MKYRRLICSCGIVSMLSFSALGKSKPVTYLTSDSDPSGNYEIIIEGNQTTFNESKSIPCPVTDEKCLPFKIVETKVSLTIESDESAADGSKVINLARGYQLEITRSMWAANTTYRLLLPPLLKEESRRFLNLRVDFDVLSTGK